MTATDASPGRKSPGTRKNTKWVPIAMSAFVALLLALMRIISPRLGLYEGIYDWLSPVTVALAAGIAQLSIVKAFRLSALMATLSSTAMVTVLVAASLGGIWWVQTNPGRTALSDTRGWDHVVNNRFDSTKPCVSQPSDEFSAGQVCQRGGTLELRMVMTGTQSTSRVAHASSANTGTNFYAETDLLFKGRAPSRSLLATSFPGLNARSWNKIAVLASRGTLKFFVNDRGLPDVVDISELSDYPPVGIVDLGSITASTIYTGNDIRCDFDNFDVYRR